MSNFVATCIGFFAALSLPFSYAATGEIGVNRCAEKNPGMTDAIRTLANVDVLESVFEKQHLDQPLVIRSAAEAGKYFSPAVAERLSKEVDFEKQAVILFAWQGSGQDRLDFTVQESFPETIQFSYRRGLTRDLRQHAKAFAVRANVTVRFEGQEVSLAPESAAYVRVEVRGILNIQVMAMGGETTGAMISAGEIQWELDFQDTKIRERAEGLHGQWVVVGGTLTMQRGVEIPVRWIVHVEGLESSKGTSQE